MIDNFCATSFFLEVLRIFLLVSCFRFNSCYCSADKASSDFKSGSHRSQRNARKSSPESSSQLFSQGGRKCPHFLSGRTTKSFIKGMLIYILYVCTDRQRVLHQLTSQANDFQFFRYASLYFCCAVEPGDNELLTLEIIHRYVELLDKYFGSVSPFC